MGVTGTRPVREAAHEVRRRRDLAGLVGLTARGVLYVVFALLATALVFGRRRGNDVDARGAVEQLSRHAFGSVLLVVLGIGFSAFALWYAYESLTGHKSRHETAERIADGARAVAYAFLAALAISALVSAHRSGDTDRTQQTWTAKVLEWSGGRLFVAVVGLVVCGVGTYLMWRAISGGRQDSQAVLEAAPRETPTVHALGAIGNCARGAVVVLLGVFIIAAALEHDPGETAGLDGLLKRLLDEPYGKVVVGLVALGLGAFGVYSVARAFVNRERSAYTP
jgi:hypothetical protein